MADSLGEAVERVAEYLPDGWQINIVLEKGSAWVKLIDPNYTEIDIDGADMTLSEQVNDALCKANDMEE